MRQDMSAPIEITGASPKNQLLHSFTRFPFQLGHASVGQKIVRNGKSDGAEATRIAAVAEFEPWRPRFHRARMEAGSSDRTKPLGQITPTPARAEAQQEVMKPFLSS